MKRYYFLLIVSLSWVAGLPMLAQYQSDKTQDTVEIQDKENLQNIRELQLPVELQRKDELQERNRLQKKEPKRSEAPQDETRIKLTGNQLVIEDLPGDGILEIYNIMGAKVFNRRVKAGTNQYILSLPKGYYIIKIGKLTRKIAIK